MAGYSSTGTAKKLGIKPGGHLTVVGADRAWRLDTLPEGVTVDRVESGDVVAAGSPTSVVVAFLHTASEIGPAVGPLARSIFPDGAVWLAWPRRAGGHQSDITDNVLRSAALPLGIVDVKVAAIDNDWSGLRFVWRKDLRGGEVPSAL